MNRVAHNRVVVFAAITVGSVAWALLCYRATLAFVTWAVGQ